MSEVRTEFHLVDGDLIVNRVQDVESILDRNKVLQNTQQAWAGGGEGRWHHFGTIPNVVLEDWMNKDGCNVIAMSNDEFGQYVKRKLRDPDNMWLRTTDRRF